MLCGLKEEECIKFRKQKMKKEKKLNAAKYSQVKYSLPYLSRF